MTARRIAQWAIGAVLVAAGAWVFVNASWYRSIEALSSERVVAVVLGQHTWHNPGSSIFFVGLGGDHPSGLDVTAACSTAAVAAAGLIITGLLISLARATVSRSLLALIVAVAIVSLVNVTRLVLLAWSASNWGLDGWFEWAHLYGGSIVSLVAIAGACAVYLRLLRRSTSAVRHRA